MGIDGMGIPLCGSHYHSIRYPGHLPGSVLRTENHPRAVWRTESAGAFHGLAGGADGLGVAQRLSNGYPRGADTRLGRVPDLDFGSAPQKRRILLFPFPGRDADAAISLRVVGGIALMPWRFPSGDRSPFRPAHQRF